MEISNLIIIFVYLLGILTHNYLIQEPKIEVIEPIVNNYNISYPKEEIIKTYYNNITNENTYYKDKINYQVRKIRFCSENAKLDTSDGMSMFPYSWEGGYFWSDKVTFDEIELGDVILYKKENTSLNIHHVVCNIYKDYLQTCGYNNLNIDKTKVYPNQIISRDCFKT